MSCLPTCLRGDANEGVQGERGIRDGWRGTVSYFQGRATRRLPAMARGCAAWGEDQSTGDDFITTRHSSTTLKYQKSGGLTQVWQSVTRPDAVRGSFLHNALFLPG